MAMPLEGMRVIEMAVMQQGPVAAMMLGDLGAEVIKIEEPIGGDLMRGFTRMQNLSMDLGGGRNIWFEGMNRNKKDIKLNLRKDEAKQIVYELVKKSDIFLQNLRPGVADRLGFSYEVLRQCNPKLIYASASMYGPNGPDAHKPGMDPNGAVRSGFASTIAPPDYHMPFHYAATLSDQMSAVMLAYAIMAAVVARERLGVGQKVDASLIASMAWLQLNQVHTYLFTGQELPTYLRTQAFNPNSNSFRAADGKWFFLSLPQPQRFWPDFCKATGLEHLEHDPRYDTMEKRAIRNQELIALFDEVFARKTRAEWFETFKKFPDFMYDPIQSAGELTKDPNMLDNKYIVDVDHPTLGSIKLLGIPFHLSETPGSIRSVTPEHGQHTEEGTIGTKLNACGRKRLYSAN
jgi:CoA:oxalate CoA-transferase